MGHWEKWMQVIMSLSKDPICSCIHFCHYFALAARYVHHCNANQTIYRAVSWKWRSSNIWTPVRIGSSLKHPFLISSLSSAPWQSNMYLRLSIEGVPLLGVKRWKQGQVQPWHWPCCSWKTLIPIGHTIWSIRRRIIISMAARCKTAA